MAHIKIAKEYEINYWNRHKSEPYNRPSKMMKIFKRPDVSGVIADVGCGPRCGILRQFSTDKMFAVDPLWSSYKKNGLVEMSPGVTIIEGEAENFVLPVKADAIFSVNALDHSGSLEKSIQNISNNLKDGGKFFMHLHMRSKEQLNKGHQMLITEQQIDRIFESWSIERKKIYSKCPIEDKPYKTYVAIVRKV